MNRVKLATGVKVAGVSFLGVLAVFGLGSLAFDMWSMFFETPPACAAQISIANVKSLLVPFLIKNGFAEERANSVHVLAVVRDESEQWPTYSIQGR